MIDFHDDGEPVADLKASGFDTWDTVEEALCDLMMSIEDLPEESEACEGCLDDDDLQVVILKRQMLSLPDGRDEINVHARIRRLGNGEVEVRLASSAPGEQTKKLLSAIHPEAMQELP